jgi:propionyl-CoA carboxylase alpha chain
VSPYYDPMLSKIIFFAPDRAAAIHGLSQALDEYVIEGVQHNARLVQSVLRHPSFVEGKTPTSFLPTHYPDGFTGVKLTSTEEEDFAVAAAAIDEVRRRWLQQPPLSGSTNDENKAVMVRMGGMFGDATYRVELDFEEHVARVAAVERDETGTTVGEPRSVKFNPLLDYQASKYLVKVSLDDTTNSIQVINEAATGEYKLQMHGADRTVLIQSLREYELSVYMKAPKEVDTSDQILSPMPGTLISYAVKEGDEVQPGQELCIVEAMKMQNIIRSPRRGTIAACKVDVGSSLASDETILVFEVEDQASSA